MSSLYLLSSGPMLPRSVVLHSTFLLTIMYLKARAYYNCVVSLNKESFLFAHLTKLNSRKSEARPLNGNWPLSAPFPP